MAAAAAAQTANNTETSPPKAIDIIDHELPFETHNTYDVVFFSTTTIHTTVTHHSSVVSAWLSALPRPTSPTFIGLDVEWRPSFHRNHSNPAATLQLCVGRTCLIYQLIHAEPSIPDSLKAFLADPNNVFVGVGVDQDLEKIEEDYGFGFNTRTVDLRSLAAEKMGRKEMKQAGVKTLAKEVLAREVVKPKRVTMSRWDSQWLTPAQVQYACVDAFVCYEVARILMNGGGGDSSSSAN